jgi:hypothetical protein
MAISSDHKLSANFTFGEMTRTGQTALQEKNRAEAEAVLPALEALCTTLLQPVRDHFGVVKVHSCFRGPAVNSAVGGSKSSQHMSGQAVDFSVPGKTLEEVFAWIVKESKLQFGQAILEGREPGKPTWIHLSLGEPFRKANNQQALTFDGKSYAPWKG